jgi:ribokinase
MITVFGSINIDLVTAVPELPRPGETVLGESYRLFPGGKGANQALAAARAGAPTRMVGCVGDDGFADLALADLSAGGVDLARVARSESNTGCATIAVSARGENLIVVASGANLRATAAQLSDLPLAPADSLLLQMEVPLAENWRAVRHAKEAGLRVILNLAPAAAVPPDILTLLDVLVMNETEADQLAAALGHATGDPAGITAALARRHDLACIVTLGAEGVVTATPADTWRDTALPVEVLDTTAAGDAFVGVLAAGLDGGLDLKTAVRRAAAAGSLACTVAGAQPSLPSRAAIDRACR